MISGLGTNMVRLAKVIEDFKLEAEIKLVISNKNCAGIDSAKALKLKTATIARDEFQSRKDHEKVVSELIEEHKIDWIFLAGYDAILGPSFVNRYVGKLINIHPSLLPHFKGLDTHKRALESAEVIHGVTVHLVNNELDSGAIIAQAKLKIKKDDDEFTLKKRVQILEHQLYPFVLVNLISGNLILFREKAVWKRRALEMSEIPKSMAMVLRGVITLPHISK